MPQPQQLAYEPQTAEAIAYHPATLNVDRADTVESKSKGEESATQLTGAVTIEHKGEKVYYSRSS
eukprot:scaffold36750_cov35-Attheya_sp.AAC.1